MKSIIQCFSAALLAAMLCAGCSGNKLVKKTPEQKPVATSTGTLNNVGTQDVPVLKTVYFAFNRADLSPEALKTLRENVNWLRTHTDVGVKTEGRCDDRGTEEYNLALGDRRVRAVWQYYTHDGISTSRIETISYGKDKPVCTEDTPSCWAQNRQVDAVIEPAGMTTK